MLGDQHTMHARRKHCTLWLLQECTETTCREQILTESGLKRTLTTLKGKWHKSVAASSSLTTELALDLGGNSLFLSGSSSIYFKFSGPGFVHWKRKNRTSYCHEKVWTTCPWTSEPRSNFNVTVGYRLMLQTIENQISWKKILLKKKSIRINVTALR